MGKSRRGRRGPRRSPADYLALDDKLPTHLVALRYEVRKFMETKVAPVIDVYTEKAEFPRALINDLASLRLLDGSREEVAAPEHPKLGLLAQCVVALEMSRVDASVSTFFNIVQTYTMVAIQSCATDAQKDKWLPRMARLEAIGAMALTEPLAGSDAVHIGCRARRVEGGWVLNGTKRWIGNATLADVVVVWAVREDNAQVTGFLVEKGFAGFHPEKIERKIGVRVVQNAHITLDNVFVPDANHMTGASLFSNGPARVLFKSRVIAAWMPVGIAMGAYEHALAYLSDRTQFGGPLTRTQLVQEKLVRMLFNIQSMLFLALRITELAEQGRVTVGQVSLAKANNTLRGRECVALARELLGGNGLVTDYGVARAFVDMEAIYTYDGTYDINTLIVGREVTRQSAITPAPPTLRVPTRSRGTLLSKRRGIRFHLMTPGDLPEVVPFAARTFAERQEICRVLGSTAADYTPWYREFFARAVPQGCCVVVRGAGDKLIGFAIARDLHAESISPELRASLCAHPRMRHVLALPADALAWYRAQLPSAMKRPGVVLHVSIGGVDAGTQNGGVASEMARLNCALGRQRGFVVAMGNVTGHASTHFFTRNVGFRVIRRLPYATFTSDGITPFAACRPSRATHYVTIERPLLFPDRCVGRPLPLAAAKL